MSYAEIKMQLEFMDALIFYKEIVYSCARGREREREKNKTLKRKLFPEYVKMLGLPSFYSVFSYQMLFMPVKNIVYLAKKQFTFHTHKATIN